MYFSMIFPDWEEENQGIADTQEVPPQKKPEDRAFIGICEDCFNAFMLKGAAYTDEEYPICDYRCPIIPHKLVAFSEAKRIHRKAMREGRATYFVNAFIHFYQDDKHFDGKRNSIWDYPKKALQIIKHFAGVISPDFSTWFGLPQPAKVWNCYRMRVFDYWLINLGVSVIYNVRWGAEETWSYCFDGVPTGAVIAIGTVASGIWQLVNRPFFIKGLYQLIQRLRPSRVILYGSDLEACMRPLQEKGIEFVAFPSSTASRFKRSKQL